MIASIVMLQYFCFTLVLAIIFLICTAKGIRVVTPINPNSVIKVLGSVWPSMPLQHQAIKFRLGDLQAANYATFNLILFCSYPLVLLYAALYYWKLRAKYEIKNVMNAQDIITFGIYSVGIAIVAITDRPEDSGRALYHFHVTASGGYYIHQAFYGMAAIFGPVMLIVFVMTYLRHRTSK